MRVESGDIRGATRVLSNDGRLAAPDAATADLLRTKHPAGPDLQPPDHELPAALSLIRESLINAITRTPSAGAPGPDGLRPGHLKQLTGPLAGAAQEDLLAALQDFCNLCLAGLVPLSVRPLFFGAGLIALRKKDGGLRPIAIGLVLRRLVARAACAAVRDRAAELLAPIQIGIGVSGGAEAAVHAARRFLESSEESVGLLKLDFVNAFNTVYRTAVVRAVEEHLPELLRLVHCAYGGKSTLLLGEHILDSACGVQQGDPLGPLLFALAIRQVSHGGNADFRVWYLDDATIGGPAHVVVAEVARIKSAAALLGLHLNDAKCEAVSSNASFIAAARAMIPGCVAVDPASSSLLGAAIGPDAVRPSLAKRANHLREITGRLSEIDRHDALVLLQISLGHPRAVYELRAGAAFRNPEALEDFDSAIRHAAESALNVRLDDKAWAQGSLPPSSGGIGLRAPSDLALAAFISSATATAQLAGTICQGAPDNLLEAARLSWVTATGASEPTGDQAARSSHWQSPLDAVRTAALLASLTTTRDVARLRGASTAESAALFSGVPSSRSGTRLTNPEVSIAVGLRLGVPVARPATCICGAALDPFGDHALNCNHGAERFHRHNEVNRRLRDSLAEAGVLAVLEPGGSSARDSRRFDGVTVAAFERGRPMAWDATIVHTCAPSHLPASAAAAGSAASHAEARKAVKYADLGDRVDFRPFGIETLGAFGTGAIELVRTLSSRIFAQTGVPGARMRLFRRLATAVQAGNARTILEAHSRSSGSQADPRQERP
jgi:hypothetical protein